MLNYEGLESRGHILTCSFNSPLKNKTKQNRYSSISRKVKGNIILYLYVQKYREILYSRNHFTILMLLREKLEMLVLGAFPKYIKYIPIVSSCQKLLLPPTNNLMKSTYTYHTHTHIEQNEKHNSIIKLK